MLLGQCISYRNIVIATLKHLKVYNWYDPYERNDCRAHLTPHMFKGLKMKYLVAL